MVISLIPCAESETRSDTSLIYQLSSISTGSAALNPSDLSLTLAHISNAIYHLSWVFELSVSNFAEVKFNTQSSGKESTKSATGASRRLRIRTQTTTTKPRSKAKRHAAFITAKCCAEQTDAG